MTTCTTCNAWDLQSGYTIDGRKVAACKRRAPQNSGGGFTKLAGWPVTFADDHCFDHIAVEK